MSIVLVNSLLFRSTTVTFIAAVLLHDIIASPRQCRSGPQEVTAQSVCASVTSIYLRTAFPETSVSRVRRTPFAMVRGLIYNQCDMHI